MTGWRSGTVAVTGGQLAYHRTGGDAPALVLSHGLTDNGMCWYRLAKALAPEFDIVMLDARGHGLSSRMPVGDDYDPARDTAEAIDGLSLSRAIVMGHSVGARATAAYAAAHPDRVMKVVLEDPPFLPPTDPTAVERRRERFRRQVEGFRSQTIDEIIAAGRATSPSWHAEDFPDWAEAKTLVDLEAMPVYRDRWQDLIAGIIAPTLIVHGDPALGSLVTGEIAAEAVAINRNISTTMIRDAGHNTRRENFADYLEVVRRFLTAA